jgi:hypothetical protein
MDAETAASTIAVLSGVFDDLLTLQQGQCAEKYSWEDLYRRVYNLVLHKYGLDVYEAIRAALQRNVRNSDSKEAFMQHARMVRDICLYLERTYVAINHKKLRRIEELAANIYDSHRVIPSRTHTHTH